MASAEVGIKKELPSLPSLSLFLLGLLCSFPVWGSPYQIELEGMGEHCILS